MLCVVLECPVGVIVVWDVKNTRFFTTVATFVMDLSLKECWWEIAQFNNMGHKKRGGPPIFCRPDFLTPIKLCYKAQIISSRARIMEKKTPTYEKFIQL